MCLCCFPSDRAKIPDKNNCRGKKKKRTTAGRGWCLPEVLMVRKAWQPGLEAAGHVASAVSLQTSIDAGDQLVFSLSPFYLV